MIIIRASNVVEEHDSQIIISYNFSWHLMLVEPAMLVFSFFAVFLICMTISRLDSKLDSVGGSNRKEGKRDGQRKREKDE